LSTLRLMFPGRPHSVWLFWGVERELGAAAAHFHAWELAREERARAAGRDRLAAWDFLGYYVNLEAPFVRTAIGVDSSDNSLDVVVNPDLTWHWKDEDSMPLWVERGVFTPEDVEQFYRDGREAIALVESRAFPFDGSYVDWRPDPAWDLPTVHPSWRTLEG